MPTNSQRNRALMLATSRRRAVIECILSDYTNDEIADELSISKLTVTNYKTLISRYYNIPLYTPINRHTLLYYMLKPYIACIIDVTLLKRFGLPTPGTALPL